MITLSDFCLDCRELKLEPLFDYWIHTHIMFTYWLFWALYSGTRSHSLWNWKQSSATEVPILKQIAKNQQIKWKGKEIYYAKIQGDAIDFSHFLFNTCWTLSTDKNIFPTLKYFKVIIAAIWCSFSTTMNIVNHHPVLYWAAQLSSQTTTRGWKMPLFCISAFLQIELTKVLAMSAVLIPETVSFHTFRKCLLVGSFLGDSLFQSTNGFIVCNDLGKNSVRLIPGILGSIITFVYQQRGIVFCMVHNF